MAAKNEPSSWVVPKNEPSSSPLIDEYSGNGSERAEQIILKKGPWTSAEDAILIEYVKKHGQGGWNHVQKFSGLSRCGKSCRLRWLNHLMPDLKKCAFSVEEKKLMVKLHSKWGNKWAKIASYLPGRTDNEIKNYWNTQAKRKERLHSQRHPLKRCSPVSDQDEGLSGSESNSGDDENQELLDGKSYPTPDSSPQFPDIDLSNMRPPRFGSQTYVYPTSSSVVKQEESGTLFPAFHDNFRCLQPHPSKMCLQVSIEDKRSLRSGEFNRGNKENHSFLKGELSAIPNSPQQFPNIFTSKMLRGGFGSQSYVYPTSNFLEQHEDSGILFPVIHDKVACLPLYPSNMCLQVSNEKQRSLRGRKLGTGKNPEPSAIPDSSLRFFDISMNDMMHQGFGSQNFIGQTSDYVNQHRGSGTLFPGFYNSSTNVCSPLGWSPDDSLQMVNRTQGFGYPYAPDSSGTIMSPFSGGTLGCHAQSNGNFSASTSLLGTEKLELPSLQYQEPGFHSRLSCTSELPCDAVDVYIQTPPESASLSGWSSLLRTEKLELPSLQYHEPGVHSQLTCPSKLPYDAVDVYIQTPPESTSLSSDSDPARNTGLLEELVHEAHSICAASNQQSEMSSTSNRVTISDTAQSSTSNLQKSEFKEYTDPRSPLGCSAASVFSEYTPPISPLSEFPLSKCFPGNENEPATAESVPNSNMGMRGISRLPDFSTPDALLEWGSHMQGFEATKDCYTFNDAIATILGESFCGDYATLLAGTSSRFTNASEGNFYPWYDMPGPCQ